MVDVLIMDVENRQMESGWNLEQIRHISPELPIIVFLDEKSPWEEEAYLQGVSHVLSKPVRPRMLNALVERSLRRSPQAASMPSASALSTSIIIPHVCRSTSLLARARPLLIV